MDFGDYFRFVLALAFVLALIGVMAWLARRFGLGQPTRLPGSPRRLKVVESLALDARRRLVLVSRDGTEHLLLLGGANEVTVESGIRPASAEASAGKPADKDSAPGEPKP